MEGVDEIVIVLVLSALFMVGIYAGYIINHEKKHKNEKKKEIRKT
jgi:hypothetical protein